MADRYRRILVPVDVEHDDGMGNAAAALDLARRIGSDGATLVAVGVIPSGNELPAAFKDKWRELMERAQNQLDLLVAAGLDDGEDMESHLLSGEDLVGELLRAVAKFNADTVLVPSHRRHGLARLTPSVGEKLSREAPVTVILMREPD